MKGLNFEKYSSNEKPEKGKVLISEPFLDDPNFERTVVYLCEHNEEGTYGIVLNKPVENVTLQDVVADIDTDKFSLFLGGPVEQDILQFVHRIDSLPGAHHIVDDVYLGGDFDVLRIMINNNEVKPDEIRFFLGYSGWAEGQLDGELDEDVWIVANIENNSIFSSSPKEMWSGILKNMGGKYKIISNYPLDPRMN